MLKPGDEEKAMLIDFDWAGEAGKPGTHSLAAMASVILESQEGLLARRTIVGFMRRGRTRCDRPLCPCCLPLLCRQT